MQKAPGEPSTFVGKVLAQAWARSNTKPSGFEKRGSVFALALRALYTCRESLRLLIVDERYRLLLMRGGFFDHIRGELDVQFRPTGRGTFLCAAHLRLSFTIVAEGVGDVHAWTVANRCFPSDASKSGIGIDAHLHRKLLPLRWNFGESFT